MPKKYNQLSLSDIYENCNDLFNNDSLCYYLHKSNKSSTFAVARHSTVSAAP